MTAESKNVGNHDTRPWAPDRQRSRAEFLLEYLSEHGVPCPACGYDLRGLREARCPECEQELELSIGVPRPRMALLFLTLVPSTFSLICAVLLLGMIVVAAIDGAGNTPPGVIVLDLFGFTSGAVGLGLIIRPYVFLSAPRSRQLTILCVSWFVHLAAFAVVLVAIMS